MAVLIHQSMSESDGKSWTLLSAAITYTVFNWMSSNKQISILHVLSLLKKEPKALLLVSSQISNRLSNNSNSNVTVTVTSFIDNWIIGLATTIFTLIGQKKKPEEWNRSHFHLVKKKKKKNIIWNVHQPEEYFFFMKCLKKKKIWVSKKRSKYQYQ